MLQIHHSCLHFNCAKIFCDRENSSWSRPTQNIGLDSHTMAQKKVVIWIDILSSRYIYFKINISQVGILLPWMGLLSCNKWICRNIICILWKMNCIEAKLKRHIFRYWSYFQRSASAHLKSSGHGIIFR